MTNPIKKIHDYFRNEVSHISRYENYEFSFISLETHEKNINLYLEKNLDELISDIRVLLISETLDGKVHLRLSNDDTYQDVLAKLTVVRNKHIDEAMQLDILKAKTLDHNLYTKICDSGYQAETKLSNILSIMNAYEKKNLELNPPKKELKKTKTHHK